MQEVMELGAEKITVPKKTSRFKFAKVLLVMLCVGLTAALTGHFVLSPKLENDARMTRTVVVNVDHMTLLRDFDSYTLNKTDNTVSINAKVSLSPNMFSEIERLSLGEIFETKNPRIYFDSFLCIDTYIIYLTATMIDFADEVIVETLVGDLFFDSFGNADVLFNIDGEYVLFSEMANFSAVEDMFFFIPFIVKAVVVTAKTTAVVAKTVAVGTVKAVTATTKKIVVLGGATKTIPTKSAILKGGQGFSTKAQLKTAMRPQSGQHVHHIVGQTQNNLSRFGAQSIHNTRNARNLNSVNHTRLSNAMNQNVNGPGTVGHNVLSRGSFEVQHHIGIQLTNKAASGASQAQIHTELVRLLRLFGLI